MPSQKFETWEEFLAALKEGGGSVDMLGCGPQVHSTRYPADQWPGETNEKRAEVTVWARFTNGDSIGSPVRDWTEWSALIADYRELAAHGGCFNDTRYHV